LDKYVKSSELQIVMT